MSGIVGMVSGAWVRKSLHRTEESAWGSKLMSQTALLSKKSLQAWSPLREAGVVRSWGRKVGVDGSCGEGLALGLELR